MSAKPTRNQRSNALFPALDECKQCFPLPPRLCEILPCLLEELGADEGRCLIRKGHLSLASELR